MAIGWLTVLRSVPWGEVISSAPKVAEGAKKLWQAVANKPPSPDMPPAGAHAAHSSDPQAVAKLQSQLAQLQASVNDLHSQMLASSELIKALAEQNTQLIKRIELNRLRVLWLAGVTGVVAIVAVWGLVMMLMR
jgi:TolA-binding protein